VDQPKILQRKDGNLLLNWEQEGVLVAVGCADPAKRLAWAKLLATAPYVMNTLLAFLDGKESTDEINKLTLRGMLRSTKTGMGK